MVALAWNGRISEPEIIHKTLIGRLFRREIPRRLVQMALRLPIPVSE